MEDRHLLYEQASKSFMLCRTPTSQTKTRIRYTSVEGRFSISTGEIDRHGCSRICRGGAEREDPQFAAICGFKWRSKHRRQLLVSRLLPVHLSLAMTDVDR